MSLFRAAFTVGGLTLISRLVGYARDMMIAATVGAGPIAEAFLVAFRLPNLFRQLFAEGAFNSAFIPLYSGIAHDEGAEKAREFMQRIFSLMVLFMSAFSIVMMVAMPWVMSGFAFGFKDDPAQFALSVTLSRITFPYLGLIALVSLLGGVLNAEGRFYVAAAAPILMNFVMLISYPLLAPFTATAAHALAWGVLLSGIVQLIWLLIESRRAGLLPRISARSLWHPSVRLFLKRMGPGIIGGGAMQLNVWINTLIATLIPGAVAYLYYADRLVQLPLAVIGTALATALLPMLSKQLRSGDVSAALSTQQRALSFSMLLTLPSAVALAFLAEPIMAILFERGAFTFHETAQSSAALAAYSVGLPAFVIVKVYAPMFFAEGDTRTPVLIAFACLIVNVALNLLLMHPLQHVGLALSTAACSWLNVVLLAFFLRKRARIGFDRALRRTVLKLAFASFGMAFVLWLATPYVWTHAKPLWSQSLEFAVLCTIGGLTYGVILLITRAYRLSVFRSYLRKK